MLIQSSEGRGFFRAGGAVSSQEGAVLKQSRYDFVNNLKNKRCDLIVSMVTVYLSCQGAVASCLGVASPSELLDLEASPSEDPSGAACQGAGPSYLQGEESENN